MMHIVSVTDITWLCKQVIMQLFREYLDGSLRNKGNCVVRCCYSDVTLMLITETTQK